MENIQKHFKEKRDDLYSRYRLARTPEEKRGIIRDMQRFNNGGEKIPGSDPTYHGHFNGRSGSAKVREILYRIWEDDGSPNSKIKI